MEASYNFQVDFHLGTCPPTWQLRGDRAGTWFGGGSQGRMVAVLGWDTKQRGFLNLQVLEVTVQSCFLQVTNIWVGPRCRAIFLNEKTLPFQLETTPFPGVSQWKRSNLEADALGGLVGAAQHGCWFLNRRLRFMKKKWCTASFTWFSLTQCSVHIINSSYAHHPSRFYETSMNFHDTL